MRKPLLALLLALTVLGGAAAAHPNLASAGSQCSIHAGTPFADVGGGATSDSTFQCGYYGGDFQQWAYLQYWSSYYGTWRNGPNQPAYSDLYGYYSGDIVGHSYAGGGTWEWTTLYCVTDAAGYHWCQRSGGAWINNPGG